MKTLHVACVQVQGAIKSMLLGLAGVVLVVAVATAVVWPLWYLATSHTRIYSFLMLVVAAGGLIAVTREKSRRRKADSTNAAPES